MKNIFFILTLLLSLNGLSQSNSCKLSNLNRANPIEFIKEVQELRQLQKYDSIIALLNSKIKSDSIIKPYYYYQLSCYFAIKGNYKEAFENLYIALNMGVSINDVLTDTDIELLYNQPEWKNVTDTILSIYKKKNGNIKNLDLSLKLWKIGVEDQRYRTLGRNNKRNNIVKGSKEFDSINRVCNMIFNNNLKYIKSLVKNKNWPLYSEVGIEAGNAAFYIVQHSGDNKLTKKALKLLEVAVKNNEASKESYAMMIDRFLMHKNKKQIYGTQVMSYSCGVDSTGKTIMGNNFIFPIEDEKNVNKRRAEIGLSSIEEYAKRFGVTYIYYPEYETMTCRKLHKHLRLESKK